MHPEQVVPTWDLRSQNEAGNVLTFNLPVGYTGTFMVEVLVSAGGPSYKRIFQVTVI